MALPPLPPGFQLDQQGSAPPLPPGFQLDSAAPPKRFGTGKSFDVAEDGSLVPSRNDYGPEGGDRTIQAIRNVGEGALQAASGITGGLAGDVAGLGAIAYDSTANAVMHPLSFYGDVPGTYADPTKVKNAVSSYFTFQPSDQNSLTSKITQFPGQVLAGGGDYMASKFDNPYAQDVVRALPLAGANLMGVKAARGPVFTAETPAMVGGKATTQTVKMPVPSQAPLPRIAGATPEERAKNYVESRTNLDWGSLNQKVRQQLTDIAQSANRLEQLDATAVERQAVLSSLDRPIENATRGQLTRDPLQQRREQLLKSTEQGTPLRQIDIEQNQRLLENLDVLRGKTGSKAVGDIQTGQSVQNALRARLNEENVKVSRLYKEAEKAGELQGPVNIDKLVDYLKNHEDPAQVSYALSRLKQLGAIKEESNGGITVSQNRPLTLNELEGIRRAAVAAGKDGGTKGHYAGELKGVIDDITDGAGGKAYAAARAARRAVGDEFERKRAVANLVDNRGMTSDRAIALEDTWRQTVLNGSVEDLQKVRASLEKSPGGKAAWSDLQAATVDYIKDRSTGGNLGMRNQAGELNSTWNGLKRAVDEVGQDKLGEIFGKDQAAAITRIVDAAQILKTEAPMLVKGSPTIDKLLTLIDKVPVAGPAVSGAVQIGRKLSEVGKAGREIRHATTSPLSGK